MISSNVKLRGFRPRSERPEADARQASRSRVTTAHAGKSLAPRNRSTPRRLSAGPTDFHQAVIAARAVSIVTDHRGRSRRDESRRSIFEMCVGVLRTSRVSGSPVSHRGTTHRVRRDYGWPGEEIHGQRGFRLSWPSVAAKQRSRQPVRRKRKCAPRQLWRRDEPLRIGALPEVTVLTLRATQGESAIADAA